jgi:alpha-L-arabinofuranosidase
MKFVPIETGRSVATRVLLPVIFLVFSCIASGQTATDIQVTSAVQQSSVKRLGINLGDQTYWDSGQLLKNLVFKNPGFEAEMYRSIMICNTVTASTCVDDNQWSPQPTGFWTGATYSVLSGSAVGTTGTVVSSTKNPNSCSGCGQIIQFDQSVNAAAGDYFVVTQSFPGGADAGWWDNIAGGGTISSETTDISPNSPGKQALLISASASGQSASVAQYFDNESGLSFIQMNGAFEVTFRAKGVGGSNKLGVNVARLMPSGAVTYLNQTVTLTNAWQDYTLTFTANETGSASGTAQLVFSVSGSSVELDDVSLDQTNSSTSNPTAFRDDVVNALKQLNPGSIRMMAAGAALGSDLPNQLQVPFARYREGYSTGASSQNVIAYGIHEFLQLCDTVGADPWITIPTATTTTEMTAFIQYLTGTGSDQWSALRIARGQSQPWTTVFNKIHIELGNETWNGSFRGESMNYNAYPQLANKVFGAARQTSGYTAAKFDLVLDGFVSSPGYDGVLLKTSTQHDSIDIAPYLLLNANNEAQATMFGALFAEPELFESASGPVGQDMATAAAAPTPTYVNVYETNLSPTGGTITEAQLSALAPSAGAGIAHTDHMLQMMRLGVQYQNAFSLPQFNFQRSDGSLVRLWGTVVDMGTTNRRRPQFLTQALANTAVGGNMLQTVQTGANPTWNQPLSSDSVVLNGAHYIQSFAFQNGTTVGTIVFNLNQTAALPVTFSGPNAPSGSVQVSQLTSANITDNNETADTVQTTTQTLSGFDPTVGLSLPPFSMTVITTAGNTVQAPTFSVPAGTYAAAQTVTIADGTSGASVYYTTDGSTPTSSSTLYTGPVTVSSSETLKAVATASGLTTSSVTSAAYVIGLSTAATPTFSVAAGTYAAAQTVSIADATTGAVIYYTTNGSTPTTSSTVYTGAITVSASETIEAIAVATNYSNSAVATAAYTITSAAATPTFSVAAGTYATAQTVSIADATTGAVIYYTTNGSTPTTSSTVYTGAITVSVSETIKAIAAATNYSNSAVATAAYTITSAAATPTFSVAAGTYTTAQTVSIADATTGAVIYYTINGSTPTTSSTKYTGAITVSASETIKAIAAATNYSNSAVATAVYTITTAAATPTFSVAAGTYTTAQTVSIADATTGAVIYYTTNGSTPTTSSTKYTGAIKVSASETIKAIAAATNHSNSAVASAAYVISSKVATPTFSVAAGTYASAQMVSIVDATSGATIYYTTNGTTPTASSTKYTAAIKVSASETIKAIATATNMTTSAVASAAYVITLPTAATPTFSVEAGTYYGAQTVSIKDATPGVTIFYSTSGLIPTTSSTKYTTALKVSASETIKAIAVHSSYKTSAAASASYVIATTVATPTFSVKGGTYYADQTVSLKDATPGAAIHYTTNGTTPTSASTKYTAAIKVSANETIKAIAIAPSLKNSAVASAAYVITTTTATPKFSVAGGTYSAAQTVSITDATPGSTIYYTTNGVTPTTASTKYTAAIKVSTTKMIKAIAKASSLKNSAVVSAQYVIESVAATPTFSVTSGAYTTEQTVSLKDATTGAKMYYTTNGATPTTASTKYTGAIKVSASETISAIATAASHATSAVARGSYAIVAGTGSGFTSSEMVLHGSAALVGSEIRMTDGGSGESSVAWKAVKVPVGTFTAGFTFQLPTSTADGFTFTIQDAPKGTWAIGENASSLGYTGITKSVAIKFALYSDSKGGAVSQTGLLENGAAPSTQSIDMSASKVSLHSGHVLFAQLVYNGTTLKETVTDMSTGAQFTHSYTVNLASILGSSKAYVGFTGSTGALTSVQNMRTWSYSGK